MLIPHRFIKLMLNEFNSQNSRKPRSQWIIDERKCLIEQEVRDLLRAANCLKDQGLKERRFSLIRRWFMIQLGLFAGLRVGEMALLRHSNLLIEEGRSSIVLFGKGNKKRSVLISQKFKSACYEYIENKKSFGYSVEEKEPLLVNLSGSRISKRALQKDFKNLLKVLGFPRHYSIHSLRHTYTTFLLQASNYNYRFVQKQLGHASIRTTQVYAGILETEGRRAIENLYSKLD